MINSNLKSVQINNYIIDKKEKKVHTYYRIELVTKFNRQFYVDKRYKDFEALQNELKKCPNFEKIKNEIEFPKSHFYTPSPKTFESRRTSLDLYMKRLIQLFGSQIPIELAKFLNLNETLDFDDEFQKRKKNTQETLNMPQISIKNLTSEQVCYALCKAELKEDIILSGFIKAFYSW